MEKRVVPDRNEFTFGPASLDAVTLQRDVDGLSQTTDSLKDAVAAQVPATVEVVPAVPGQATVSVTGFVQLIGAPAGTPFLYVVGALIGSWPVDVTGLNPLVSQRRPLAVADTSGFFDDTQNVILGPDTGNSYNLYRGLSNSGKPLPLLTAPATTNRLGPQIEVSSVNAVVPLGGSGARVATWDGSAYVNSAVAESSSGNVVAVGPSSQAGFPVAALHRTATTSGHRLNVFDPATNTWESSTSVQIGASRSGTGIACDFKDGYGVIWSPFATTHRERLTVFKANRGTPDVVEYILGLSSEAILTVALGLDGQGFGVIEPQTFFSFEHNVGATLYTDVLVEEVDDGLGGTILVPTFDTIRTSAWVAPDLAVIGGNIAYVDGGVTYYVPRLAFVHVDTTVSVTTLTFEEFEDTTSTTGVYDLVRVPDPAGIPTVFFIIRSGSTYYAYKITAL